MTKEEAIQRIEAHIAYHRNGEYGFNKTNEAMEMALAALRAQLARDSHDGASNEQVTEPLRPNVSSVSEPPLATKNQVTSDWISVEDRLPEQTDPATFVLFITTQGMQHVGTYFKGGSTSQFDGFYSCAVRHQVTHWMPLPEPPKKEATDHAGAGEA